MNRTYKRWALGLGVSLLVALAPLRAYSDIWGGDVMVLTQILANAIQQLSQLEQIVGTGQNNLELLRQINAGINDSLALMRTVSPYTDPGVFKDWRTVERATTELAALYGTVAASRDSAIQRNADQSAAEAIALNNETYDYTQKIDDVSEAIQNDSHSVSPGGAAKLTAESTGVMLAVMNQSLRTQATSLKLQAETMAIENQREKEKTRFFLDSSESLESAMNSLPVDFEIPRF